MITVLESIELSTDYLRKKGIESPRINAELLLASVLNCKRLDLYLMFDKTVTDSELDTYRNFIKRRAGFEPLQYITGKVEFYGLNFIVNPSVLIPRPETELLVEKIIEYFKNESRIKILDIGCGSGNIAISLAVNLSDAAIVATDVNIDSITVAEENAKINSVENRIRFIRHNILNDPISELNDFDVVVSNPPYVSEIDYLSLQKEIKNFEPETAVSDFGDGFKFYRTIISKSDKLLKKGGRIYFELSLGQSITVEKLMNQNNFDKILISKDYLGIERIICGVKT